MKKTIKAQSMLEYTLLVGVVVSVLLIVLLGTNRPGKTSIEQQLTNAYDKSGDALSTAVTNLETKAFLNK